jgi:hypothetical protein
VGESLESTIASKGRRITVARTFAARCPYCRTYLPDWCSEDQLGTEVVCSWCGQRFRIVGSALGDDGRTFALAFTFGLLGLVVAFLASFLRAAPAQGGPVVGPMLPRLAIDGQFLAILVGGLLIGVVLGLAVGMSRSSERRRNAAQRIKEEGNAKITQRPADEIHALKEEVQRLKEQAASHNRELEKPRPLHREVPSLELDAPDADAFEPAARGRDGGDVGDLDERITETAPARMVAPMADADAEVPDVALKLPATVTPASGNEFCVFLALILPLIATCISFVLLLRGVNAQLAIGCVTVLLTAILLAIDASDLGSVDLKGRRREGAGMVFLGTLLMWVLVYPVVYFRRRHFGRPNRGVLAILVALIFVAVPLATPLLLHMGLFTADPPPCTSPEVVQVLDRLIKQNARVPVVRVDSHREIRFDRDARTRHGECRVHPQIGPNVRLAFRVAWIDQATGQFSVTIDDAAR